MGQNLHRGAPGRTGLDRADPRATGPIDGHVDRPHGAVLLSIRADSVRLRAGSVRLRALCVRLSDRVRP